MGKRVIQRVILVALVLALSALPLLAQTIKVTVRFNSATIADTLGENHYVQIRGDLNGVDGGMLPDYNVVAWDSDSDLELTNVGGDYWECSFRMYPEDTLKYKFWTGFDASTGTSVVWDGWEGGINDPGGIGEGNRVFISGSADTVLAVQYYNSTTSNKAQYYRPYTVYEDSIAVYFRINMAGVEQTEDFDPAVDTPVYVYGGDPLGSSDSWIPFLELTRETEADGDTSFWSGVDYIAVADLASTEWQNYKFVYMTDGTSEAWESISDRYFALTPGMEDTTIHWVYYNDQGPRSGEMVTTTITWLMDPGALQDLGFFDRSAGDEGDKIYVSGPKGWDLPDQGIEVTYQPLLGYWIAQEDFTKYPGDKLQYKFVVYYDSSRVDTLSDYYFPGLPGRDLWEEPSSTYGANRTFTITSDAEQVLEGDYGYDYQFYSAIPPEGVLPDDITVTFNVDMAPATSSTTNPDNPVFVPGVDSCYIYFESPILMISQGLNAYEETLRLEDPDGNGIYTASMDFSAPTVYQFGFRVGYEDVLNGGGVEAGRRYYQYIWPTTHDATSGETVWPTTYEFPTITWVANDLPSENPPDFSNDITGVHEIAAGTPDRWFLSPNFPNPFNPSTMLTYHVAANEQVNITVYSILGQKVRTLVDAPQTPGVYRTVWDGQDAKGNTLASGVYFVRLTSPSYTQARRITLVR